MEPLGYCLGGSLDLNSTMHNYILPDHFVDLLILKLLPARDLIDDHLGNKNPINKLNRKLKILLRINTKRIIEK